MLNRIIWTPFTYRCKIIISRSNMYIIFKFFFFVTLIKNDKYFIIYDCRLLWQIIHFILVLKLLLLFNFSARCDNSSIRLHDPCLLTIFYTLTNTKKYEKLKYQYSNEHDCYFKHESYLPHLIYTKNIFYWSLSINEKRLAWLIDVFDLLKISNFD